MITEKKLPSYFLWFDMETTGLEPTRDQILEVACVVTTTDLLSIDNTMVNQVIKPNEPLTMDIVVADMHARSGLLEELSGGYSLKLTEECICILIRELGRELGPYDRIILAGNSIQLDRAFIHMFMPKLDKILHYRHFDVSTLRTAVHFWVQEIAPTGSTVHRASVDLQWSLEWARKFRECFSVNLDKFFPIPRISLTE